MSSCKSLSLLSFLTVAMGVSAAFADENSYLLTYRFEPGQFLSYESAEDVIIKMLNANQTDEEGRLVQSTSAQITHAIKTYRVVTVDEQDQATLEPIIEKVRMKSRVGDKPPTSYDSTTGEAPLKEFKPVAETVGRPLARLHIAPNGKLLKVTVLDDDAPKAAIDAARKRDPTINFLVVFPEKPIKIGEKWTEKYDTTVPLSDGLNQTVKLIRSFELVQVVEDVATIQFRTTSLVPTSDPEILSQLVQQTPSGTIEFDLKQGKILRRRKEIDEKVLGAYGPKTVLEAHGNSVEVLITGESQLKVEENEASKFISKGPTKPKSPRSSKSSK